MKYQKIITISILIFLILSILNFIRIFLEFNTYNSFSSSANRTELKTIGNEMHKTSDSLFDNIINTPKVINIFKNAHTATNEEKNSIRNNLHTSLSAQYKNFTKYGIQQLHFHLPNNHSFLRFHKPKKFGDDLTKVRESVKYVNQHKKPVAGFEEGKVFNGYRFVYPLFDEKNKHIGSVEVSSSLLNFKTIYQKNNKRHIDLIFAKEHIEKKLFASQLKNYKNYHSLDNYLIQSTIYDYNKKKCSHNVLISEFLNDAAIKRKIQNIDTYSFSKIINNNIYTMDFIPFYNDFLHTKVGYSIIFSESDYLEYFYLSLIGSILSVLIFSIFVGYMMLLNRRNLYSETKKKEVELKHENLLVSNHLVESVINGSNDLIFYKDKNFTYIGCNNAYAVSLGKEKSEIIGKTDFDLFDYKEATLFRNTDNVVLQKNETIFYYEWSKFANGNDVYLHTQKIPFHYDEKSNEFIGILGMCRDVSKLYETQKELREQTYRDELTKIHNRKSYNERLAELLSHFKRYKSTFSMILFDIDNFKLINDNYGHDVGDKTLIELCNLVNSSIRENDYFFRIGGEEFIVLSIDKNNGANVLAENIRNVIEKKLNVIEGKVITVSLGVSSVREDDTPSSIFKRVDDYLYESKNNGKNRVVCD